MCIFCFVLSHESHAGIASESLRVLIVSQTKAKLMQQAPYLSPESVRVQVPNVDALVGLHPESVTVNVDWVGGRQQLLGRTVLPVRFFDAQNRQLGRYGAIVLATAEAPLLETCRPIARGDILATSDIRVVVKDALGQPVGALRQLAMAVGHESLGSLPERSVLTAAMIRTVPDSRRGAMVTVVLGRSGVYLDVKGELLADAVIGHRVKVRLQIGSRRIVEGQVIDAETVLLD